MKNCLKDKGMVGNIIPVVTKSENGLLNNQNQVVSEIYRILDKYFVSIKFMLPFVQ